MNQGDDKVRREVRIAHISSFDANGKPVGRISSFPMYESVENGQVVDKKYIVESAEEMQRIEETLIKNGKIKGNAEGKANSSDDFYASNFSYKDKAGVYLVPEEWIKDYCRIRDKEDIALQKGELVHNPKGDSQALRIDMKKKERDEEKQQVAQAQVEKTSENVGNSSQMAYNDRSR